MNDTTLTLTGWVGSDVTVQQAGGHAVATFRVGSTPRRFRDGAWVSGNTTWFQVKAWRHVAEHVARSVHRGDPVIVQGRLTVELWEREDGVSVSRHVVVASAVGHDLAHGTSAFTKAVRTPHEGAEDRVVSPGQQSPAEATTVLADAPQAPHAA
ncbi:MAG: single-stranded DNA-binding protein [Nocardioides sp.]|uniref:single-stranded DNA-binding protein n=1 Tax=Nocardioides sp. TaxID=35761 RepID=UPI003F0ED0BD